MLRWTVATYDETEALLRALRLSSRGKRNMTAVLVTSAEVVPRTILRQDSKSNPVLNYRGSSRILVRGIPDELSPEHVRTKFAKADANTTQPHTAHSIATHAAQHLSI